MGVQKDLAKARKQLEAIKKLIDTPTPDVAGARTTVGELKKALAATEKTAKAKATEGDEGIRTLAATVADCLATVNKKPFDGATALDALKKATTAATAAVQAATPK